MQVLLKKCQTWNYNSKWYLQTNPLSCKGQFAPLPPSLTLLQCAVPGSRKFDLAAMNRSLCVAPFLSKQINGKRSIKNSAVIFGNALRNHDLLTLKLIRHTYLHNKGIFKLNYLIISYLMNEKQYSLINRSQVHSFFNQAET